MTLYHHVLLKIGKTRLPFTRLYIKLVNGDTYFFKFDDVSFVDDLLFLLIGVLFLYFFHFRLLITQVWEEA